MPHSPRKNAFYIDGTGKWTNAEPKSHTFMAPVGAPLPSLLIDGTPPEPWRGLAPVFEWKAFPKIQESIARAAHGAEYEFKG